jgi:hypothetical protein
MLTGTSKKKSRAGGGGKINSVAKLYNQLKRKETVVRKTVPTTAPKTTTKTTAKKKQPKVYPSWQNYENTLKTVDNLKIQLPFFGSDRMFDQFYKLIDVPDAHEVSMPSETMLVEDDDEEYSEESVAEATSHGEDTAEEVGGGGGDGNREHEEDDEDSGGENIINEMSVSGGSNFYNYGFDELFKRYVLRALVSPFNIDAEYRYEDESAMLPPTITDDDDDDDNSLLTTGLSSYLERAINLFGKQAVNMLQFRQVKPFLLQNKDGGTIGVKAVSTTRKLAKSDRRQCLVDYHQECARKIQETVAPLRLSLSNYDRVAAGGAICGCCLTATRLYLIDSTDIENETVLALTKALSHSHVLFNIGDVLYRPFLSTEELTQNFDIRLAYRGLKNNEQSRNSVLKAERVHSMAFYRRIYAVHAAVYSTVNWLWYRQVARHRNLYDARSCDDDVPPVVLTLARRLSPLFDTVNTVFLEILLQKRRVTIQYV